MSILKSISVPDPEFLQGTKQNNNKKNALQKLSDITPVHTHSGYFGATVLMKLVATRLTSKSV